MSALTDQLQHLFSTSYDTTEWFVSFQQAVKGLTHEQASQKLTPEGDSIFGIVAHLTYWNGRYLKKMRNETQTSTMIRDNEQTFKATEHEDWNELLKKAEEVFEGWSQYLAMLSTKDAEHFIAIGNTAMHNAYHIGQIVLLRKLQGSWPKEEGVK